jgi:hypothetical protein
MAFLPNMPQIEHANSPTAAPGRTGAAVARDSPGCFPAFLRVFKARLSMKPTVKRSLAPKIWPSLQGIARYHSDMRHFGIKRAFATAVKLVAEWRMVIFCAASESSFIRLCIHAEPGAGTADNN